MSNKPAKEMNNLELASYMDYSILRPEYTDEKMIELTKWGVAHNVKCICINPIHLELLAPYVVDKNDITTLAPTIDFPFGNGTTSMRISQIEEMGSFDYVKEIDIVIYFGKLKSKEYDYVTNDLTKCVEAAHKHNLVLKVILETDALTEQEVRQGVECIIKSGADMIKTSTGFLTGHELKGASTDIIKVILDQNKGRCKVKGSGCVRTREHFTELIDLGVSRIGINYSSAPKILGLDEVL